MHGNFRNTSLTHHTKMVLLFRESIGNGPVKKTNHKYNFQDRNVVTHTTVKMYLYKNQFTALIFCGLHVKPHWFQGLRKQYYPQLDPKLGHEKYAMLQIPCECVAGNKSFKSRGTLVCKNLNNLNTKLLLNVHTGLCWYLPTMETSLN